MSQDKTNSSISQEILAKRLNELLTHKGNLAYQIEPLQKQLDQINEQLKSLNDLAPLFYIVESQTMQRQNELVKQAALAAEKSEAEKQ